MSQTWSPPESGVTTFASLYGALNACLAALRSQFSGTSAPADPVQGQMFFNTDTSRVYQYDGSAWVDLTDHLPAFTAVETEVEDARGSAASVDARISVAINPDGTLKGDAPATGWWTEESETPSYDTASTFTLPGDLTAVYTPWRAVRLTQTADDQGHVVSSSYNGGGDVTTVTVTCAVDAGLSLVEYGQEPGNEPHNRSVGEVKMWPTETPPLAWLECDGSAVSRTVYADLFAVIGETWGNGDGSTTFNLPDLRGQFVRGWDHGAGTDPDAASRTDRGDGTTGDHVGTQQADANKQHNHNLTHPVSYDLEDTSVETWETKAGLRHLGTASLNTTNSGGNEARPKNVGLMFIIGY